jgi:hypothetical protein
VLGGDVAQLVDVTHGDPVDLGPDHPRVGVHERGHREAPVPEASVVGQGVAEIADSGDHHVPVLGEAQLARHLEQEVLDVVADPPGAIAAEVAEVLADLGRVDARQLGQPLG